MRAVLIINPVSGDDEPNSKKVATIQTWLTSAPFEAEVCYTSQERGAGVIAREAVAAGVEVVLVGGGDGTVSEVARELVNQPTTLGILPIGTFNNIARSIGVLTELPVATMIIAAGHVRKIDVGLANDTHYFFEAAGAGLDATLFPVGEEIKSGRWTRLLQAGRLAFRYEPQSFSLTFDRPLREVLSPPSQTRMSARALSGYTVRRNALLVVIANGPYYGGGFTVAADARLRDGRLTVSVYRRFSKWELFRHFQSIARGRRRYSPKIETFTAKEIELASPNAVAVHIDGQPFGTTPVKLRALPGALRVFAPPEDSAKKVPGSARLL
ncbi:MAG: diacylglycerol kinase family protein [Chthoniobacteraceae bacterium]